MPGRLLKNHPALACAFIAQAAWNQSTMRDRIDRVEADATPHWLCG